MVLLVEQLYPNVDTSASFQSRHDIVTPPESPKPEPQPMVMRPLTPPELSPPPIQEAFTVSINVMLSTVFPSFAQHYYFDFLMTFSHVFSVLHT